MNILDVLVSEASAIYVMDRAYVIYKRLYTFHRLGSYFVVRAKSNTKFQQLYSHANDREQGLIYDQSGMLTIAQLYKNRWQVELLCCVQHMKKK